MKIDPAKIDQAVHRLAAGELVGMPTETVYGLAGDATQVEAVAKIFALKGRPLGHPLIVHLHALQQLTQWAASVPQIAWDLAERFWPGPLTLILPKHPQVHRVVTGGHETIGVRLPSHPVARTLLRAFAEQYSGAVAAPSANRFGRVSPTRAEHVRQEFGDALELVLDGGDCEVGIESTIVDLSQAQPAILRPGQIGRARLEAVLGPVLARPKTQTPAPGTLSSHYAVSVPTYAQQNASLLGQQNGGVLRGWIGTQRPESSPVDWTLEILGDDPAGFGQGLYAALRRLEAAGVASIYIQELPQDEAWQGVRDRITRACAEHAPR